jgi:hypothetical protein
VGGAAGRSGNNQDGKEGARSEEVSIYADTVQEHIRRDTALNNAITVNRRLELKNCKPDGRRVRWGQEN